MRLFLLAAALASGFLTVLPPRSSASAAPGPLGDYVAYMGWTLSDKSIRSVRASGEVTREHHEPSAWLRVSRGVVYRERYEYPEAQSATEAGYSGRLFWTSNLNGFTVPWTGRGRERAASLAYVLSNNLAELQGEVQTSATPEIGVVRITPPNAAAVDLWIDRQSGKLTRFIISPDDAPSTYIIDRFAEIARGKRLIADYHIGSRKYVTTRIAVNETIPDSDLAPPAPTATWKFGAATGTSIDKWERGVIVGATINGVTGRFLFDTGASEIALTAGFARRAGITTLGEVEVATATGSAKAHFGRAASVSLDGSTLSNVIVTTGVLAGELDGLLGYDIAAASIVGVDFRANRLSIHDPATFQAPGGLWFPVPVDLGYETPWVTAKFANGSSGYMMIDSGNSADTVVGYDLHTVVTGRQFLRGIRGAGSILSAQMRCGYSDVIEVERLRLRDSVVCFAQQGGKDGILGFAFLSRFNWLLDYPEAMIFLKTK